MGNPKVKEGKRKRKASPVKLVTPLKKRNMNNTVEVMDTGAPGTGSPTKVTVLKIDIVSCNGKSLSKTELGASDLESIWKDSLLRNLTELAGYTSSKTKNFTEIRVQYQLKKPMSLRTISFEAEFSHERSSAQGIEILRCRVVGLNDVRKAQIGERVKVTVINPNFDVTPQQIIEWLSHYGACHDGHR
jgi:hypothetical protein